MKKILSILFVLALVLVAFMPASQAQTYGTITLSSCPTQVTGSAASNVNQVVDIRYNRQVAIALKFQGNNTGTDTVNAVFAPSVDNTLYDTTKWIVVGAPANGNTAVTVSTNVDMTAYGWLKLLYVTNAAASVTVTNMSCVVSLKPGH